MESRASNLKVAVVEVALATLQVDLAAAIAALPQNARVVWIEQVQEHLSQTTFYFADVDWSLSWASVENMVNVEKKNLVTLGYLEDGGGNKVFYGTYTLNTVSAAVVKVTIYYQVYSRDQDITPVAIQATQSEVFINQLAQEIALQLLAAQKLKNNG